MPINYTYTENLGVYSLTNNETVPLNYTIQLVECEVSSLLKEGILAPNETKVLTFSVDGVYSIVLVKQGLTETLPNIVVLKDLKSSFITLAEKILCGCSKCEECQECTECDDYLKIWMKAMAINQLTYPKYNPTIQSLFELNSCLYAERVLLCTKLEKVYGNTDIKQILLQTIAYYYLAFYTVDIESAFSQQEENYILKLYKFDKIAKCIRKLGVLNKPVEIPSIFNSVFNSIFS